MDYKGIKAPFTTNRSGGFATESGSDQLKKIIMLSIDYCPSDNPFNTDVGIEFPVFDINETSLQARLMLRIQQVFDRLRKQNRAKLITAEPKSENENLAIDIEYVDMQTDRPDSLLVPVTSIGGA